VKKQKGKLIDMNLPVIKKRYQIFSTSDIYIFIAVITITTVL